MAKTVQNLIVDRSTARDFTVVVINFQHFCFCSRWDMTTEETPTKASKTLGSTTPGSATPIDASTTPGKKVYLPLNLKKMKQF